MILIKKFIAVFLCIIIFSCLFTPFGTLATSGEVDSDYIKGLIISLSSVSGLTFPDWTTASAFANDFLDKILEQQTESQLNFLSAIESCEYIDINNNFSKTIVSPSILQAFETALSDTYDINVDSELGNISASIKLPKQFDFPNVNKVVYFEDVNPCYLVGNEIFVSDLTPGLNLLCSSPGFEVDIYVYYTGSKLFPVIKVNDTHYFRLGYSGVTVSNYGVNSISLCLRFNHIYYSSEKIVEYIDMNSFLNGYGGFLPFDYTVSDKLLDYYGFSFGFAYLDENSNLIGFQYPKHDDGYFYASSDLTSLISGSNGYDSWSEFILNDFRLNNDGQIYSFYTGDYTFKADFSVWGVDFTEYLYPVGVHVTNDLTALPMYQFFNILCSYSLGYLDYSVGTVIYPEMFVYIDSDYLTTSNNLRSQLLLGNAVIRVPYNLDNIISEGEDMTVLPVPDDVLDDGTNVGGSVDHGGTGGSIPDLVVPDVDSEPIQSFISSFLDSIGNFFDWISSFISSLPTVITIPVFGVFIIFVCIGFIKLVL